VILGALGLVVLLAVAGGWWFLMGPGAEPPPPLDPEPQASGGPLPGSGNPANAATGSPGGEVTPEGGAEDGGGRAAPAPPPPPTDPAEIKRKVAALMAQGRAALGSHEYAKAQASFVEVLRIEPTNFDAEELRIKAAAGVVEEKRFNRDLESAKQAFKDQDWGSSLYRLYRLQQERPEMKALSLYIRNANHNWGVQSMEAFQIADALEHFRDALEQEPGDKAIQQHMDVAGRYEQRRRNTAYDAYVAKLRLRALDAP
jgi:tetratricopeptide (TPR) repeat protein